MPNYNKMAQQTALQGAIKPLQPQMQMPRTVLPNFNPQPFQTGQRSLGLQGAQSAQLKPQFPQPTGIPSMPSLTVGDNGS